MVEVTENKIKVSSKGQIVIPSEIREKYGYGKGTELVVIPLDESRILLERGCLNSLSYLVFSRMLKLQRFC